jgi:hypothetical protein
METTDPPYESERFLAENSRAELKRREHFWKLALIILAIVAAGLVIATLLWTCACRKKTQLAVVKYAWVQMQKNQGNDESGGRLLRAIVAETDKCPTIQQDEETVVMRRRSPPSRAAFPVAICEVSLRANSVARLENRILPARPVEANNIVVIGDTGCRIVHHSQEQSCFDDEGWPFQRIALKAVAQTTDQSFVLHLGDLHYREHACIDSHLRCGGSPYGDNWETWEAEFFRPADPLLRKAPWIIMRGNHEDCARAGAGWVFFFASLDHPGDAACKDDLDRYNVTIGKTQDNRKRLLAVMDTANAGSKFASKKRGEGYVKSLDFLEGNAKALGEHKSEIWLAVHQPLWLRNMNGFQDDHKDGDGNACESPKEKLSPIRKKLESDQTKLATVVLAGDTHAFQFFRPESSTVPIQIVAGNGGTMLDRLHKKAEQGSKCPTKDENGVPQIDAEQTLRTKPDESVTSFGVKGSAMTFVQHGFTVLQREGSKWTATQFDSAGGKIVACWFSEVLSPTAADAAGCEGVRDGLQSPADLLAPDSESD